MKTVKMITAKSGHTLCVASLSYNELVDRHPNLRHAFAYDTHYVVKNWDKEGKTFFYLAKGHKEKPKPNEIVGWYRSGKFWASFGTNLEDAINGMQKDGWLYA